MRRQENNSSVMKTIKTLFLVFVVLYLLNWTGIFNPFKNTFIRTVSPLMLKVYTFSSATLETINALFHFYSLKTEIKMLQTEKTSMRNELIELQTLKLENERLNTILTLKNDIYYDSETCSILGFDSSNWFKSLLLNKGTKQGITEKMLVISSKGVVGKITEVFPYASRVMLTSDRNSKIGVRILRTRDIGILEGDNSHIAILKFIPTSSSFKEGDIVISLGQDEGGAEDFYVGEIIERIDKESQYYSEAKVRLAHTDHSLEEVLVVKSSKGNHTNNNTGNPSINEPSVK